MGARATLASPLSGCNDALHATKEENLAYLEAAIQTRLSESMRLVRAWPLPARKLKGL